MSRRPDHRLTGSMRALDLVRRTLDPAILLGPGLVGALAGFAREGEPLLRFGWSALDAPDASA